MGTINKIGIEFFEKNPAVSPYFIPLAIRENGHPWSIALDSHILFAGDTGSGKNSALDGAIRQLAPFIESGVVKLYGVDPKEQLQPYGLTRLFAALAGSAFAPDLFEVVAEVHAEMKRRLSEKRSNLDGGNLGRSHGASEDSPATVLLIDEFDSLLYYLRAEGNEGRAVVRQIEEILFMGRSAGVYIIAATQSLSKEVMGRMVDNFRTVALFRQRSVHFNNLILGEGAAEHGFNSTLIPLASPANGYETAGIALAMNGTGGPERIRFAYSSDEDIVALIKEYIKN